MTSQRARHAVLASVLLHGCAGSSAPVAAPPPPAPAPTASEYFDSSGRSDAYSGGVRQIPIDTPKGRFMVWTKRTGNNPTTKVLLLHGGPGATHEYFEVFDSYFPGASIEYYFYDQLGSHYSDHPDDPSLWELPRFVDELEQVRVALNLTRDNFYLLGHSWGGILAMEYALTYQQNIEGLIISNMMSSAPAYNKYAHEVLMPQLDPAVLAEIQRLEAAEDYQNPRYMGLLLPNYYVQHILRRPVEEWPEPVTRAFGHINPAVYIPMQGPSEMGLSGKLEKWDRTADLAKIEVPTLVIGGRYDTMDPAFMESMSRSLKRGRYLYLRNSGHLAMYDDQESYMAGVIQFVRDVEAGRL